MDKHILLKHLKTILEPILHLISKCVKSVNGVYPDKDGNVELEIDSGLPSVSAPHQMLVTDADGKTVWTERTHYIGDLALTEKVTGRTALYDEFGLYAMQVDMKRTPESPQNIYCVFNGDIVTTNEYGCIGNMSLVFPEFPDTGEQFLYMGDMLVTKAEMGVTFVAYERVLKTLESKFLSEDIPRYGADGQVHIIEWDGNTDGLDSFDANLFNYYKVSPINVELDHISKVRVIAANNTSGNVVENEATLGTNCYNGLGYIVVTEAGNCVTSEGYEFTAPSTGVYFTKHNYESGLRWTRYLEIDTRRENSILYLTNPSGVKYAITVDDSGNLTATEVTD